MTDIKEMDGVRREDAEETTYSRLKDRLTGFKNRKIARAVVAYTLALWLVVQLADVGFPLLKVPEYALVALIVGGVLALPIVLVLAWLIDYGFRRPSQRKASDEDDTLSSCAATVLMLAACALACVIALRAVAASEDSRDASDCVGKAPVEDLLPWD